MKNTKYTPPTTAMTPSARAAHFLEHCHRQSPGERVSWRDLVRVIDNLPHLPNKTNSKVVALFRSSHHVGRILREQYKLDIESNGDGVRVLENVHDITKFSVAKAAKELDLKRKKLDDRLKIVTERKAEFRNDAEGRSLKQFVERASTATKSVRNHLPSSNEIRGLLVSGDD